MRSIWLSILCVACGGDGGGGISPQQLPAELANVTCARLAECCTAEEFMDATLGQDTEAECRVLFTGFGGLLGKVIESSIAAGRLIYHGDRIADCLALIGDVACADFQAVNSGPFPNGQCEDPFEGRVEIGGECANDFDCISEYCSGDSMDFEGNITFGACADAPLAGEPCDDNECAEGLFCDFADGEICAELLETGVECTSDQQCKSDNCDDASVPGICSATATCDGM